MIAAFNFFHATAAGGGGALVYDTFTGTNGTNLTSHTPDTSPGGSSWAVYNGGGSLDGSGYVLGNDNTLTWSRWNAYLIDAGVGDCTIEYVFVTSYYGSTGGLTGIWARGTDHNDGYVLEARSYDNTITLTKWDSGGSTLATQSYTFADTTTYTLKLVLSGSSLTCYVNGSLLFGGAVTDSTWSNSRTFHGIGVYCSGGVYGTNKSDTITITT